MPERLLLDSGGDYLLLDAADALLLEAEAGVPVEYNANTQANTWTTYQATISTGNTINANTQQSVWSALQASITQPTTVETATQTNQWTTYQADIEVTGPVEFDAATQNVVWLPLRATIDAGGATGGWMLRKPESKKEREQRIREERERLGILEPPKREVISLKPKTESLDTELISALRAELAEDEQVQAVTREAFRILRERFEPPTESDDTRRKRLLRKAAAALLLA